jgi:hypothetical protein
MKKLPIVFVISLVVICLDNYFETRSTHFYFIGVLVGGWYGSDIKTRLETTKRKPKFQYTIKAHPTKYKGVMFRSRLEARWAAFFDLVGWEWEYEPVDLNGWTPDFRLTVEELGSPLFVEVKPFSTLTEFETHVCWLYVFKYGIGIVGDNPFVSFFCLRGGKTKKAINDFMTTTTARNHWKKAGQITQYKGDNSGR